MGPEAAINAVFYNQIQAIEDEAERAEFVEKQARRVLRGHRHPPPRLRARRSTRSIEPDDLRAELIRRYAEAAGKDRRFTERHNPITPA